MAIDPERVKALFQAAIERGDPASRRAFVDDEIGDDDELPAYAIRTRGDDFAWQQNSRRVQWLSWPTLLLLVAIVAAASQLFGKGDEFPQALASQTMIANSGMVKAIAFRPDGAMLLSVGLDGSMAILDLAARRENPDRPQGVGRVRCAVFSADSRVLAVSTATASVSLHDLVDHQSRTLNDVRASTRAPPAWRFLRTVRPSRSGSRMGESRSGMQQPAAIDRLCRGIRNSLPRWRSRLPGRRWPLRVVTLRHESGIWRPAARY
jgi:hypothetical protein